MKPNYKWIYHLSLLSFIIITGFYYNLRSTYNLAANELFRIINHSGAWIDVVSWWRLPSLTPVFLAVNFGCSLQCIAILYSIATPLLLYVIFLMCTYLLKKEHSGFVLSGALLGVNTAFFMGKHDTLEAMAWGYMGCLIIQRLCIKYRDTKSFRMISTWGMFLFATFVMLMHLTPITTFNDEVLKSGFYFTNGFRFLFEKGLPIYIFMLLLGSYIALFLFEKKHSVNFLFGILFYVLIVIRQSGFSIDFENLLLPLVFWGVWLFSETVLIYPKHVQTKFWIVSVVLLIGAFGALRFQTTYQQRYNYMKTFLQAAENTGHSKISMFHELQRVNKYINPRYVAVEMTLVSTLLQHPPTTVYFYDTLRHPEQTTGLIVDEVHTYKTLNTNYFPFKDSTYTEIFTPLLEHIVIVDVSCGAEHYASDQGIPYLPDENHTKVKFFHVENRVASNAYEGDYAMEATRSSPYVFSTRISDVQPYDMMRVTVLRKGSEEGHLVISDPFGGKIFYTKEHRIMPMNDTAWQELSILIEIPPNITSLSVYGWNSTNGNSIVYYDNMHIYTWRKQ
ncbi:hypothetical protein FACS1894201_03260 [Bacteroidia bacterium]|nr:hypothetical protein FACS1894201_03260 [Bacteroidia bacterium]